mmetsp:Transcript_11356/g.18793  ORF Transcript_11356/g.18793 Transcript_11356/m.18793 type:complete len:101 (-) Transcript_11356:532-834(-)|eukprot:CAMPEP_0119019726 /NCGR_PEP_ID=MMETSP1176-20130426/22510_1 /TAXON_ID=265551 /ORGANISM="Synedropsis recta cf, Strain CCMP1620" /LENGTH=100 /DNA_ID=CAMNT_0006973993 /DNA_START=66 /DNA_END=368 /DNA_ORIENTATION=+
MIDSTLGSLISILLTNNFHSAATSGCISQKASNYFALCRRRPKKQKQQQNCNGNGDDDPLEVNEPISATYNQDFTASKSLLRLLKAKASWDRVYSKLIMQ